VVPVDFRPFKIPSSFASIDFEMQPDFFRNPIANFELTIGGFQSLNGSDVCTYMEVIKYYIFRFPLVSICFITMQIDHENFSSISLNLVTPNVVKIPKPQSRVVVDVRPQQNRV